MNTKMKQIALPLVVVIAVLLAFSSPAAADYSGDHPLTTYEHGFVDNGGLIYETETDSSTYTQLDTAGPGQPLDSMTQNIAITIPAGATVKTARLYNYVTWSKSDNGDKYVSGDPAEADLTFNGVTVTCQNPAAPIPNSIYYPSGAVQYWDTKGPNYACGIKYDYPSGTFAWDVTNLVTGTGTYVATIANNDSTPTQNEYFCTFGFGLLVVYEDADGTDNELEYWIDEGCDVILNTSKWGVYEPIATTNAMFPGCIEDVENKSADLTIVTMAPDLGYWSNWPASRNMNYFNGLTTADEIGPSIIDPSIPSGYPNPRTRTIGSSTLAGMWHGYNMYVSCWLQPCDNILYLQDRDLGTGRGDNMAVSNAFLVVTVTPSIPANVTFDHKKLNLHSNGILKAFIKLPEGYSISDIDTSTVVIMCEGAKAIDCNIIPGKEALEAKFKIQDLDVNTGTNVKLTVTGRMLTTGEKFCGSNTLEVR